MVLVVVVEDEKEREKYLEFLAENEDIELVQARDGTYTADITLVDKRRDDADDASGASDTRKRGVTREMQRPTGRGKASTASRGSALSDNGNFLTYSHFCGLINGSGQLEARTRSTKWLQGLINDLYEERAKRVTGSLDSDEVDGATLSNERFPVFVVDYLSGRYGLPEIVDQVSWDLLLNVHSNRRQKLYVELFARFLEEYYDTQDLGFFLRVKRIVDNVIQRSVRSAWTKDFYNSKQRSATAVKNGTQVFLKWAEVVAVARRLHGSNANPEFQNFLDLVDEHCVALHEVVSARDDAATQQPARGEQVIESTQLLHLAVAQFHDTRAEHQTAVPGVAAKDAVLERIFASAQQDYRAKLRELGFAEELAKQQVKSDLDERERLDEMCQAIKRSLIASDETRDALTDVNEHTIRDWAVDLLDRQDAEVSRRSSVASGPKGDQEREQRVGAELSRGRADTEPDAGLRQSRRGSKFSTASSSKPMGPSPPTSPRPPPPAHDPEDEVAPGKERDMNEAAELQIPLDDGAIEITHTPQELGEGDAGTVASLPSGLRTVDEAAPEYASSASSSTRGRRSSDAQARGSQSTSSPPPPPPPPPSPPPPPPPPPSQPPPPPPSARNAAATSRQGTRPPAHSVGASSRGASSARTAPSFAGPVTQEQVSRPSTESIMREIQTCLARFKERYLKHVMGATRDLPTTVSFEIEQEVRAQLDTKARSVLNDVISGGRGHAYLYECAAVPNASSYSMLEAEFKAILRVHNQSQGSYYQMSKQVESFCKHILDEARQEIEPLVALLVTYANARLGGGGTGGNGTQMNQ